MTRILTGVVLSAMVCMTASGQSNKPASDSRSPKPAPARIADLDLDESWMMRLIALNEAAAREGEVTHADLERLEMNYSNLGILYGEVGMPLKAEGAIKRAIDLLANGPQDKLAAEIDGLAVLHVSMDKLRQAEKEELKALQIRTAVADPVGIALAESSLAGLYDEEGKFTKASDYAEKAYDVLADRMDVSMEDRIGVRHTLGFALTGTRTCARGIETLNDALALAKNSPELSSKSVGYSEYELGYGYWHCGDRVNASRWLGRGTTDMKADYGWGRALYLNAMKKYANFLREDGQLEAAVSAEAVVNEARSVVDANTLADRAQGFRPSGFK